MSNHRSQSGITAVFHHALRRLLQVDKPIPNLTEVELIAERDSNFRWNFVANSFDVTFFMAAVSFVSATTILPLFVTKLTDSTLALAVLAIFSQAGWYLPQLFTANFVERLPRKKPVAVELGFLTERLPTMLLILAAWVASSSTTLALVLFFFFFIWRELGGGIIAPAWQDLIARCFPVEWRGRFLGMNMFLGTGLGVLAASLSTWFLETYAFPLNFIYIFGTATVAILISWIGLSFVREPVEPKRSPKRNTRQYLSELPSVVRADDNFRSFLIARFMLSLAAMGSGFLTVAAIQRWQIPDGEVGTYTAVSLIGQTVANLLIGMLADRYGHKVSLEFASLAALIAFGIAWFAPSAEWMIPVFFMQGFFLGARIVSGMLVVLEFSPSGRRPTYVGLANSLIGIASAIAPLIGAVLFELSASWLFGASAICGLVAFVMMRYWVREPRYANQTAV